MTDTTTASASSTPPAQASVPESEGMSQREGRPSAFPRVLSGIAVVLLLGLAAGLWHQHQQLQTLRQQLSAQLAQGNAAARDAGQSAGQALEILRRQAERLDTLQVGQGQAQAQLDSLEQALQIVTDSGSDIMLLNDIDRLAIMAQQQLQLGGNVGNAIVALESAQAQLARANRSNFASLQQSINGDIDRLRAVASVDVAVLTARLDELYALIGEAPLQTPDEAGSALPAGSAPSPSVEALSAAAQAAPVDTADASWWRNALQAGQAWSVQAWRSVRQDLDRLIDVRRIGDSAALLMSPDQAERLRDNLRLRVMTARLALLMKQPQVWQSELAVLQTAFDARYDHRSAKTRRAQSLVASLSDTAIAVALPTLENSLRAIQAQRDASEQDFQQRSATETPRRADGNGNMAGAAANGNAADAEAGNAVTGAAGNGGAGVDAAAGSRSDGNVPDAPLPPDAAPAAPSSSNGAGAAAQNDASGVGQPSAPPQPEVAPSPAPGATAPEAPPRAAPAPDSVAGMRS